MREDNGSIDVGAESSRSLYDMKERRLVAACEGEGGCESCCDRGRAKGGGETVVAVIGKGLGGCSTVVVVGEDAALS